MNTPLTNNLPQLHLGFLALVAATTQKRVKRGRTRVRVPRPDVLHDFPRQSAGPAAALLEVECNRQLLDSFGASAKPKVANRLPAVRLAPRDGAGELLRLQGRGCQEVRDMNACGSRGSQCAVTLSSVTSSSSSGATTGVVVVAGS